MTTLQPGSLVRITGGPKAYVGNIARLVGPSPYAPDRWLLDVGTRVEDTKTTCIVLDYHPGDFTADKCPHCGTLHAPKVLMSGQQICVVCATIWEAGR